MDRRVVVFALSVALGACDIPFGLRSFPVPDAPPPDGPPPTLLWKAMSGGREHTCAIAADSTLWCWGRNDYNQLGLGIATHEVDVPTQIGSESWLAVATSNYHTCAIRADSTLWCFGANNNGELGTGTGAVVADRFQVAGAWQAVASGGAHTCAISQSDQSIWCWGANTGGEIGTGVAGGVHIPPTQVAGGPWLAVSAGSVFTCAIDTAHVAWCWGDDTYDELGVNQSVVFSAVPLPVVTSDTYERIAAGGFNTCAIRGDGKLRCWGRNEHGEVGDDSVTMRPVPAVVDNDRFSDWIDVASGSSHACGVRVDGSLWCWGSDEFDQLATEIGALAFKTVPVKASDGPFTAVVAGDDHTCVLGRDTQISCAGLAGNGALGAGAGSHVAPARVAGTWKKVSAGIESTCAIDTDDHLACWGDNIGGGVGDGTLLGRKEPVMIQPTIAWADVAVGDHACAVTTLHELGCWGRGVFGQLGDGLSTNESSPNQITNPSASWDLVGARSVSCAITGGTDLYCWGPNDHSQAGGPASAAYVIPLPATTGVSAVANGYFHTCLVANGVVKCVGDGSVGQLGNGSLNPAMSFVAASLPPGQTAVTAGDFHTCAGAGTAYTCWGYNSQGEIGDQTTTTRLSPVALAGAWQAVSAGGGHTCGIQIDGSLWCWGDNTYGGLADGSFFDRHEPTRVGTEIGWTAVSVGANHACALAGVDLWCWGRATGALGDGTAWRSQLVVIH